MTNQDLNNTANGRTRLALVEFIGNLVLDRMAAEARAGTYAEALDQSRRHLQELETDVANLKAKLEQPVDVNVGSTDTLSKTATVSDLVDRMSA